MADPIQYVCSSFLRSNSCPRGGACIFRHAAKGTVVVCGGADIRADCVWGRIRHSPGHARGANGETIRAYVTLPVPDLLQTPTVNSTPNSKKNNKSSNAKLKNTGNEPSTSSLQTSASTTTKNTPENHSPQKNSKGKKKRNKKQLAKVSKDEEIQNRMNVEDWVKAPEFVPRDNNATKTTAKVKFNDTDADKSKRRLCPHAERDGLCNAHTAGECTYLHGDLCDLCARPALHPHNADQRRQHTQACIRQHEADMELAFAVARSNEMVCGVCFENVLQKAIGERRFGILPNCNHCFCLACIRKWRQSKQFENKIIRACPECRVTSDFVCPSSYWVDTKEAKERVITSYKAVLAAKDCKYFLSGRGCCPFGNKCFYRHTMTDGTQVDVGPPPSVRKILNLDGSGSGTGSGSGNGGSHDANSLLQRFLLLDYLHDTWLNGDTDEDDDDDDHNDGDDDDDDDLPAMLDMVELLEDADIDTLEVLGFL